ERTGDRFHLRTFFRARRRGCTLWDPPSTSRNQEPNADLTGDHDVAIGSRPRGRPSVSQAVGDGKPSQDSTARWAGRRGRGDVSADVDLAQELNPDPRAPCSSEGRLGGGLAAVPFPVRGSDLTRQVPGNREAQLNARGVKISGGIVVSAEVIRSETHLWSQVELRTGAPSPGAVGTVTDRAQADHAKPRPRRDPHGGIRKPTRARPGAAVAEPNRGDRAISVREFGRAEQEAP